MLLAGCALCHAYFAGPAGILPIIILGVGSYLAGISQRRGLCVAWIMVCIASLLFYKYTNFFIQEIIANISPSFADEGDRISKELLPGLPPLAISFFTFEFVHYLVEIYRGHRPIRSPITFALFSIYWPSLVAGPIKRYRQFVTSARRGMHQVELDDIRAGAIRVSIGVMKKFSADVLSGWIDFMDDNYEAIPTGERWLVFAAIGARILLDFSGYSDMAIGFARLMGIRLPENFRWPYLATSINDFWHRWHISLSSWIRDYVYIPLGGNRHGIPRKVVNLMVAMSLCGLWHGAAWNFILWGLYHGIGLVLSTSVGQLIRSGAGYVVRHMAVCVPGNARICQFISGLWLAFCWISTLFFVFAGWLLFFYPASKAWSMLSLLFTM